MSERDGAIRDRFQLWFFRELTEAQRNKLFELQGLVPAGETIKFEAMQRKSLDYLLAHAIPQPTPRA